MLYIQVIDLHYGISEKMWLEVDDDHSFVEICEKEILRAMLKSAGPCFMVLRMTCIILNIKHCIIITVNHCISY